MTHNVKSIANYFLSLAEKKNQTLSPMKLQKLVYFAHGWHLALTGKPLIDEMVEAWSYGPVIPSLYQEFKHFGSGSITSQAKDYRFIDGKIQFETPEIPINDPVIPLLDRIWDIYGKFTAIQLSNLTHEKGTPWDKTRNGETPNNTDIPNNSIQEYFHTLIEAK